MAQSSTSSTTKQKITVTVDSNLIAEIDQLSNNRSAVVEEALCLWRKQKIESQLREFYLNRSSKMKEDEIAWADATQDEAISHWSELEENS